MMDFFARFVGLMNGPLLGTIDQLIGQANAWVTGWIVPAFGTAVALWAIAMAGGFGRQFHVAEFAKLCLFIALISAMLVISRYDYYVRDLFMTAIPAGINQISGTAVGSIAHAWDIVNNQAKDAMLSTWQTVSWKAPGYLMLTALILTVYLLCAMACIVYGFGVWLKGYLLTALYAILGVVIIPLFIFRTTRPIVTAWIGATIAAVMLQALSVIFALLVLGVENSLIHTVLLGTGLSSTARVSMLISGALMFAIFAWIARDIPNVAAQLCGGVSYTPYALANATYGVFPAVARLAGQGVKTLFNETRQAIRSPGGGSAAAAPPGPSLSARTP